MDETVAYMMMPGGGGEEEEEENENCSGMGGGATAVQPTQLVALQTEDGTQQLAVPIIDPTTGQESYMIIDQSSIQAEDGQQLFIVGDTNDGDDSVAQHHQYQILHDATAGENNGGGLLVLNGDNGGAANATAAVYYMQSNGGGDELGDGQVLATMAADGSSISYCKTELDGSYCAVAGDGTLIGLVEQPNSSSTLAASTTTSSLDTASMIHIVGVKNDRNQAVVRPQVALVKPSTKVERTAATGVSSYRAPRKQSLSANTDYSQDYKPPPGLTGDIIKDTVLVDQRVDQLCKNLPISLADKETLRLSLMTHGLYHPAAIMFARGIARSSIRGSGGRGSRGGARGRPRTIRPRVIKCDQCGYEFSAEVNERILVEHITKYHMKEQAQQQHERLRPTPASPLRPPLQSYKCSDCSESFQQVAALLNHQKETHTYRSPTPELPGTGLRSPEKPKKAVEVVRKLADEWDEEEEEEEDKDKVNGGQQNAVLEAGRKAAPEAEQVVLEDENQGVLKVGGEQTLVVAELKNGGSYQTELAATGVLRSDDDSALQNGASLKEAAEEVAEVASRADAEHIEEPVAVNKEAEESVDTGVPATDEHAPKQEEDEEASIVADVDAILNDTERIMGYVDAALAGKTVQLPAKRKAEELELPSSTMPASGGGGGENTKRKPTVQCEECYEVFEDAEKLAWHALNDH